MYTKVNPMDTKDLVRHTVYVTREQKAFLRKHREFNLSGWLRPRLQKRMEDEIFLLQQG